MLRNFERNWTKIENFRLLWDVEREKRKTWLKRGDKQLHLMRNKVKSGSACENPYKCSHDRISNDDECIQRRSATTQSRSRQRNAKNVEQRKPLTRWRRSFSWWFCVINNFKANFFDCARSWQLLDSGFVMFFNQIDCVVANCIHNEIMSKYWSCHGVKWSGFEKNMAWEGWGREDEGF